MRFSFLINFSLTAAAAAAAATSDPTQQLQQQPLRQTVSSAKAERPRSRRCDECEQAELNTDESALAQAVHGEAIAYFEAQRLAAAAER